MNIIGIDSLKALAFIEGQIAEFQEDLVYAYTEKIKVPEWKVKEYAELAAKQEKAFHTLEELVADREAMLGRDYEPSIAFSA